MLLPLLALALSAAPPDGAILVKASASLFDSPRVPDAELAEMRGGFDLPNGLDIAIGIDVRTSIDGALVLHSVYNSDGPDAGLHVYGGDGGPQVSAGGVSVGGASADATVSVSRETNGTTVVSAPGTGPAAVTIVSGPPPSQGDNGAALPLTANGPPVQTDQGSYSLASTGKSDVVTFSGPSIEVQHLIGQATGVVIANTANNRAIDTISTVNVDLGNVPVALINSAFAMAHVAFDSARAH